MVLHKNRRYCQDRFYSHDCSFRFPPPILLVFLALFSALLNPPLPVPSSIWLLTMNWHSVFEWDKKEGKKMETLSLVWLSLLLKKKSVPSLGFGRSSRVVISIWSAASVKLCVWRPKGTSVYRLYGWPLTHHIVSWHLFSLVFSFSLCQTGLI